MRPQRSSTVVTQAPNETGSSRSAATGRAFAPSAVISAAVDSRLPGRGLVLDFLSVEECSRDSPSCTVRAVTATS
jgi:hypothetical protein